MKDSKIQKFKVTEKKGESLFFVLVFTVIAMMLIAAKLPFFMVIFFGGFSYLLYKFFKKPAIGGTKDIFEFYLSANDVLRDDDRKWFGFEIQDILIRGERILQSMPDAPPLIYFTLGALYNKIGGHKAAIEHLSYIAENEQSDEKNRSIASPELRRYVNILRKIEQNPSEAPLTTAAIRSLERARKNRITTLLENSRREIWALEEKRQSQMEGKHQENRILQSINEESYAESNENARIKDSRKTDKTFKASLSEMLAETNLSVKNTDGRRQPISEVLHEIYDQNKG